MKTLVKGSDLLVVVNCGLNGGVLKLPAASGGGRLLALNRRKSRQHWVFARADRVGNLRYKMEILIGGSFTGEPHFFCHRWERVCFRGACSDCGQKE